MAGATEVASLYARLSLRLDKWDEGDKKIERAKSGVKMLGVAFAALGAIRWAGGIISQVTELGATITDMVAKLGVPAETLQEMGFAADESGSSLDELGGGFIRLSKLMDAANRGGKTQRETLNDAGVEWKNLDGTLRPVEDVFTDLSDHFKAMPNEQDRARLAVRLFGKSGANLLPLLNQGSEGIDEMRKHFVALGAEMTGDQAAALESFGDEQHDLSVAWQGMKNQLVLALLPSLRKIVTGITAWFMANRKLISQRLELIFRGLVNALKALWVVLGLVFEVVGRLLDHWKASAVAIGALIIATYALGEASVFAGLQAMYAWIKGMLPLLAMAAAIMAVILLVQDLYSWLTGGESVLKDLWAEGLEGLRKRFEVVIEWVQNKLDKLANKIIEVLGLGEEKKKIGGAIADTLQKANDNRIVAEQSQAGNSLFLKSGQGATDKLSDADYRAALRAQGLSENFIADVSVRRGAARAQRAITGGQQASALDAITGTAATVSNANMSVVDAPASLAPGDVGAGGIVKGGQSKIDVKIENKLTVNEAQDPGGTVRAMSSIGDDNVRQVTDALGGKAVP